MFASSYVQQACKVSIPHVWFRLMRFGSMVAIPLQEPPSQRTLLATGQHVKK